MICVSSRIVPSLPVITLAIHAMKLFRRCCSRYVQGIAFGVATSRAVEPICAILSAEPLWLLTAIALVDAAATLSDCVFMVLCNSRVTIAVRSRSLMRISNHWLAQTSGLLCSKPKRCIVGDHVNSERSDGRYYLFLLFSTIHPTTSDMLPLFRLLLLLLSRPGCCCCCCFSSDGEEMEEVFNKRESIDIEEGERKMQGLVQHENVYDRGHCCCCCCCCCCLYCVR
jgi:hypothetical protein